MVYIFAFLTAIDAENMDPVGIATLQTDKTFYKELETVELTIALQTGSHVTYTIDYGDGSVETVNDPHMLSFILPVTFSHMYVPINTF